MSRTIGGDVVLKVQGIQVADSKSYEKIQEELSRLRPGAVVTLAVLREGRVIELSGPLP